MESVPVGGLNLTVVPVEPDVVPKAPIVLPKEFDPNKPVPVDGVACAVGWPKREVAWVGCACGWPKSPLEVVAPKPKAGLACVPNPVLVPDPNIPVVPAGGADAWAVDPNIPVEAAGVPKIPPPDVPAPNPSVSVMRLLSIGIQQLSISCYLQSLYWVLLLQTL